MLRIAIANKKADLVFVFTLPSEEDQIERRLI
jgi:hypothetical protein